MKKKLLLMCGILLYSYNLKYAVSDFHAFTLPKNKINILIEHQLLNNTVDILNLKQQELKNINPKFGAIGDLTGNQFKLRYGITNKLMCIILINKQNIQYSSDNWLKNKKTIFLTRYNFYQNFSNTNAISFDLGIEKDKADQVQYSNIDLLESLAYKILGKNIQIKETNIPSFPYEITFYNQDNNQTITLKTKPTIYSDLSDKSYFISLNFEKRFEKSFFDVFLTLKKTNIKTNIYANDELEQKALNKGYNLNKNLDRSEKALNIGFNISYSPNMNIFELTYYYARFFRDKNLDYINYNHILSLTWARGINKHFLVYIGGKLLYRQFNGVIPYLYNQYSQTTFDHKYGWARVGFGYYF